MVKFLLVVTIAALIGGFIGHYQKSTEFFSGHHARVARMIDGE